MFTTEFMTSKHTFIIPVLLLTFFFTSCSEEPKFQFENQGREVPEFNADHVYQYITEQVEFGPRVPNSEAHRQAIQYFNDHFRETAGNRSVFVQSFQLEAYGDSLQLYNLIASFNPQHRDRVMLAAHWDSRPRAEEDAENPESPILGADDGGSGVGVLMEFARIFRENPPPIGVDIVLFDGEDYGESGDMANYFLGSRYWSENPPVPGYNPRFGILLDMVGGEEAVFPKEGYSMEYAPSLVNEIWRIAAEFGYDDLFIDQPGGKVADDHIIVQRITGIPVINIIHHRIEPTGTVRFPEYWHTHRDNLDIIDTDVIQSVGNVLLELIYNRIPAS